ncbi:MAG: hypothetical protein II869_01150, partial [Synergistaceae bacterium]|nr:hypothetical protein [Synergistaceae bacterium]
NKNLSTQIEEDEAMHKTLRDILKSDFEAVRQEGRKEGRQEGRREGRQEGLNNANERVAKDMLRKNLPLSLIEEISRLSEDTIRGLARTLGIAVMQ